MPSARDLLSGLYAHLLNRTFSVYWAARAPHVLRWLEVRPDDDVLEVGCGSGSWSAYLAPRAGSYTALDLSSDAIEGARQWLSVSEPYRPTARVRFAQANAEHLPFAERSFSKVLAVDVVEHVADEAAAMGEIARVLRPGGTVVMTTMLADRPTYLWGIDFHEHAREYAPRSFVGMFEQVGLNVVDLFYFYRAPSMIARELQTRAAQLGPGRAPGLALAVAIPCRLLAALETVVPAGRPGGIGARAVKS